MFGILRFVPSSGGKAVEHLVSQRLTYVGRDKDCSIRLEDDSVDGKQFVISCSDQVKIQNLSRKLPTEVNQKSIGLREDQELRDKDTISFGKRKFLWIMSSSSGRRDPPKHDCLKGKRVSEPVRKVAVVTPNRRYLPLEVDWAAMPPDAKRRRTIDPSAATPDTCFTRRVRYDRQLRQKVATPNRRKHSVSRNPTTPALSSPKKKSISFAQPLESPQLTFNHETAFNKSITPGRFYRRNGDPFQFRGFNPVPEEPMSPGLLSGCGSFLSMDDTQMTRRSSARVSTPYPNRSMRGSSQLNKTQSPGPSGIYFSSIQEEVSQRIEHDATPSSYFSSTSGSPRIMRAESPTILPGGSGSPFQGRRSLVQSSRSSSYGTPQEQSLQSQNDSLYVNASGSSQMRIQDFEGSSMNQSRYNWTTEGMSSPRPDSFTKTPPYMRTPRRSRAPIESPGSAAFSPNPSEANTSGYVLLSPRGRSIINRAFDRNDMSLQLMSPQHSSSRRLLNFAPRTPDDRRHGEPAQSLSVHVLTKSLRKKLNRTPLGSSLNPMGTPSSGGRGRTPKNSEAFIEIPITPEPALNFTTKSTRSTGSKRAALPQSSDLDLSRVSRKSSSIIAPSPSSPVGASKRKSSMRADDDSPSKNGPPTRTLSRLSGKSSDLSLLSNPVIAPKSEPKISTKGPSTQKKKSVADESVSPQIATPRLSRSSKRSLELSPRPSSVPVVPRVSRKSINVGSTSSPVVTSNRKSSVKGDENGTPQPKLPRGSWRAAPPQSSEPHSSRLSRKSSDLRKSIPLTPVEVPCNEPKRSNKGTPNSESTNKRISVKNELSNSPSLEAVPRQSRRPKLSVGATRRQSSEPDLSRSPLKSGGLRKSALQLTPVGAAKEERKLSLGSSPQQPSKAGSSRSSRKPSDLNSSDLTSTVTPSPPKRSNTFTLDSTRKAGKPKISEKSPPLSPRNTRASTYMDLSPDKVTPPGTSVEFNLRSSRKLSTKKKDSPSTPLTASKIGFLSHKRTLSKSLSAESMVNASPKSYLRNSLPVSLERSSRKSGTSLFQGKAQPKSSGSRSASESPVEANVNLDRLSRASLVGRSSRRSGTPSVLSLHSGICKTSVGKRSSLKSETPEGSGSVDRRSKASLVGRSSRSSGTPSVLSLPRGIRKTSVGKRSSLNSETPEGSGSVDRRSRASLVGDAAQLLYLSASPGSTERTPNSTIPDIIVIPPTPTRSAGATSASGGPVLGRRSSRRSGTPSLSSVPNGIRETSVGERSSLKSETPQASEVGLKSPKKSARSSIKNIIRSSRQSSDEGPVAPLEISLTTVSLPRTSRPSSESEAPVTPPRSVEPEIVMRSSRKTSRLQYGTGVPSTPTSAIRRRNTRRSGKTPVPSTSVQKKLILASPRKDSTVKKLSIDPEKPDKNKMAALIACHKKKSPTKEQRPSTSSSDEKTSLGKSSAENLTPLKDLDAQPEERSPEDALLDALDLSRKSTMVAEPKRPSRRLRSSTNRRISAQSSVHPSSSKSTPTSPPKSIKKLLFKTPLVEYEGSHQTVEKTPSRSLKGILVPSPTTASEEPMSRVFTTSPVVDFTDASGRKKIFRASPNSKSKAGGIRELFPDEESDMNIWTLFEASSSDSRSSGRKRKGSEPTDTTPPKKTNAPGNLESASPSQSTRRKRAVGGDTAVLSIKRSRNVAVESAKKASIVTSARKATTAKVNSPKSTKRNLQVQFEDSFESPKSFTSRYSPNPSTSKSPSPKVSPKQLSKAVAKAKTTSKAQASKKAPVQSKAGGVSRKVTPVKSPVKTRRAAAKSPKSLPKNPPRAGKAGTTVQPSKTSSSKAKPKKAAKPAKAKAPLKGSRSKAQKSSSPAKSPTKTRRVAVAAKSPKKVVPVKSRSKSSKATKSSTPAASSAKTRLRTVVKSPKKAVQAAKVQPKAAGRKATASIPVKSPPKTRRVAAVKSPKKAVQKAPPKAGKTAKPAKSPPKASPSKRKVAQKALPKTGKPAKSPSKASTIKVKSPKATTSRAKPKKVSAPSPQKVSPKKTRGKLANLKAEAPKPTQGAKPKNVPKAQPRLSVPPRPLKGKAVGVKNSSGSQKIVQSPKKSPKQTRARKAAAASTARK